MKVLQLNLGLWIDFPELCNMEKSKNKINEVIGTKKVIEGMLADFEGAQKKEREAFKKMTREEQKQYLKEQKDLLNRMSII